MKKYKEKLRCMASFCLAAIIGFAECGNVAYASGTTDAITKTETVVNSVATPEGIPNGYKVLLNQQGTGSALSTTTYTLKAKNTYYIELAGGSGGDDSWYITNEDNTQTRYYLNGGNGGYQLLTITPDSNTTLTIYAGGVGNTYSGAGQPDGQNPAGGGSSSIWIGTPGSGGTLIAAAGGGGGAVGGTSDMQGYDGGEGTGTSSDHTTLYHDFNTSYNGTKGRTWFSWTASANTSTWRNIIVSDANLYDSGGAVSGKDRLPGWYVGMTANQFFDKFILYSDVVEGGGGGGGFPSGTCSYYHWSGWYNYNGWNWVSNNPYYCISTGGSGYTIDSTIAKNSYGLDLSYTAKDGYNDGNGYVKIWAQCFTLTVDPNGGIFEGSSGMTELNGEYLDAIHIANPTRTGYTFAGWTRTGGGTWDDSTKTYVYQKANESFTAKWVEDTYSITYNGLDGVNSNPNNPTSYTYNTTTFTLKNPTKSGYRFIGWTGTDISSATTTVTIVQGSTGNKTYTASWQKLSTVPLDGFVNLTYKSFTQKDASGNTVSLASGGVDLNWSGFTDANGCGGYYIYYKEASSNTYIKYSTTRQTNTQTTKAFNNSTSADKAVKDNAKPNAVDLTSYETTFDLTNGGTTFTWKQPEDNGTTYNFKVTATDKYYSMTGYQQVLVAAGYSYEDAVKCTSVETLLKDPNYLTSITNSANARTMCKAYYASKMTSMIDSDYSEKLNYLNYLCGLKAYLIHNGTPTNLLPTSGWTYGYYYTHVIGGTGVSDTSSSRYDSEWITDHDYTKLTTVNNFYRFADGDYNSAVYKSKTAINTSLYIGGSLKIEGSNSGSAATIGFSNSSGGFYNTVSTINYTTYSGKSGVPNYGSLAGTWNKTESTRNSWSTAQWGKYNGTGATDYSNGSPIQATKKDGGNQFVYKNYASFTGSASISLTSSNTSTSQYLTVATNGGSTLIKNLYLVPSSSSSTVTAPNLGIAEETEAWTSNAISVNVKTGIKGYLIKVDTSANTTVTWSNGIFQTSNSKYVASSSGQQYLHIAAVDGAGLVSDTVYIAIPGTVSKGADSISYTIHYNGNGNTGGSTASSEHVFGSGKALTANGFTKTGYVFKGWDTDSSGTTVVYTDIQQVLNLTTTNKDTIELYAVWEPITYRISYHANGGSGSIPDTVLTYNNMGFISDQGSLTYGNREFLGWSLVEDIDPSNVYASISYLPYQMVNNLTTTNGGVIDLYAVWQDQGVSISGEAYNIRTQTVGAFQKGEKGYINFSTNGYAMTVKIEYPDGWQNADEVTMDETLYSDSGKAILKVPLDATDGPYEIKLTTTNIYGYTAETTLTIQVESSILDELRTRIK